MTKSTRKHQQAAQVPVSKDQTRLKKLDSDVYAMLVIVAAWLAAMVLINPSGDFPLNDDWCYGRAVYSLLHDHELRFVGITTMTLIAQVLWGALFCAIFGFSFTVLRVCTLVLGLAGLIALYKLLRETRVSRWVAALGCLVVAWNPLYLSLSYSFMTDVPFTALALIATYVYVRALKSDSTGMIVVGTVLACAAALIRQFGIALPIGFGLAYLVKNGTGLRSWVKALVPVAVVAGVLAMYVFVLKSTGRLPSFYNIQATSMSKFLSIGPRGWMAGILDVFRTTYVYLGLFLLPFLIISFHWSWRVLTSLQRRINLCVSAASGLGIMAMLVHDNNWMPLKRSAGDYIVDIGIGPPTLRDVFVLNYPNYPVATGHFWTVVTILGVVGGALLVWHILSAIEALVSRDKDSFSAYDRGLMVMALSITLMCLAPLVPMSVFAYFDRYFLCAMPLMLVVIALTTGSLARPNRLFAASAVVVLLFIATYSICGTHDYMSWNRARWQAARELTKSGEVKPEEVDAGYEFNGWHNYQEGNPDQRWWRDVYDDYIITFGQTSGYDEVKTYTYRRWMPLGEGTIYVLSKPCW